MAREPLSVAGDSRQQALGVPETIRQALKIPQKNGRLMVSISLLLLAPYSFLVWARDRAVGPLMDDDDDHGEAFTASLGRLLCLESIFFVAFCAISLSTMALTVYASSMAYTGNSLTLKDAIRRTLASWKRPTMTCFCVAVITAAYAFLLLMLIGAISLVVTGDALMATVVFLVSSAALFYAFLAVIWMLGFAVSVVEEGCCGMDALARAAKLVRGRKLDGFLLMLLMLLLGAPISSLLYLNTREDDQGTTVRVSVGIIAAALACLLKILTFMVFSVFYHECRRYHGEKVDGGDEYELLSNTVHAANPFP